MEYKVGDIVRVVHSNEGDVGFEDRISAIDEDGWICVGDEDLPYPQGCWHVAADLAPATAPASDYERANADALPILPGSPLDERLQQPVEASAFAQAAQGDDALAVALYEAAVLNTVVDELQVASVDAPLDGETFDEWVARVGKAVEDTAFYWKQIAAANLELASINGDLLENAQHELDNLRQQLADAQAGSEGNGGL